MGVVVAAAIFSLLVAGQPSAMHILHSTTRIWALDCRFLLLFCHILLFATDGAPLVSTYPQPFSRRPSLQKNNKRICDHVSMGTTLVALCCKGGVVVGADTRTSVSGVVSNRFAHKLTPLSDTIVVCRSGSAADTQALCDEAKLELESLEFSHNRVLQVSQVAKLLRWYMVNSGGNDLQASLLCAGINISTEQGELYAILPSGALLQHDVYAVSGSGSTYIMGFLDEQLASSDDLLEEEDAIALVGKAIKLAMDRDGSSGGFVRIYSIATKRRRSITIYLSERQDGEETSDSEKTSTATSASAELPGFAPPSPLQ